MFLIAPFLVPVIVVVNQPLCAKQSITEKELIKFLINLRTSNSDIIELEFSFWNIKILNCQFPS